jgi:hypothetical protein
VSKRRTTRSPRGLSLPGNESLDPGDARDSRQKESTMGIEQDAERDLSLTDEDAESVAGGKKAKKTAVKHTAPRSSPVTYVNVPASTTAAPDDSGTTAWTDDCDDPAV